MQKWSAKKLYARRGPGPNVPEEVRSSSGDSRSRFPLASNIAKKTNIWQTTKKQSPRTSGSYLTRTRRASRHGADLWIYWAQGLPGLPGQSAPGVQDRCPPWQVPALGCSRNSCFSFLDKWYDFLWAKVFSNEKILFPKPVINFLGNNHIFEWKSHIFEADS